MKRNHKIYLALAGAAILFFASFKYFEREMFALLGLALVVFGVYQFWSSVRFRRKAVKVEGKVIGLDMWSGGTNYPKVEFKTREGKKIVFNSRFGSGGRIKIGDPIKVFYHPDHPRKARVASFILFWLPGPLFSFVGLFFLLCAYVKYFMR